MNMMTSLDNIPLKTSSTSINDDSDDPVVKDILNEFNNEINNQIEPPLSPSPFPLQSESNIQIQPKINNDYIINNQNISRKNQYKSLSTNSFYNEDYLRKSAIIIIIIAIIFSPIIYNSFIDKLPSFLSSFFNTYDIYIKLFIVFIILYLLMIKNFI